MKKVLVSVIALFLFISIGMTAEKIVTKEVVKVPVKEVTKEVKSADVSIVTWDMWRNAKDMASKLDNEGSFELAIVAYLDYAKFGEALGKSYLKAWGLQNAAYCIIKMHKKDNKVDLTKAKEYLEQASQIKEADSDCVRCITSNLDYINYHLGNKKELTVAPKSFITPEVKKEVGPKK